MDDEQWKQIPGYYGNYLVSDRGRVYSIKSEKILSDWIVNKHYRAVTLCADNKRKVELVHRLVAKMFIPNPDNKPEVNHIDCNPSNNTVLNLEWVTSKENINHAINSGRYIEGRKRRSEKISKPIIGTNIKTGEVKYYPSARATVKDGFNENCVAHCAAGYKWRHSHKGYKWEYVKENLHG